MPPRETGKNWGFERAAAKVPVKDCHRTLPALAILRLPRNWRPRLSGVVCVKFCKSDQGWRKGFLTQGVILTTATGAGETALLRRSALAGQL
jgi:hypothetical protein